MKLPLILSALCLCGLTPSGATTDIYPINDYQEPQLEVQTPTQQWDILDDGIHASWADRNVHYQQHLVPQLAPTDQASLSAWKGERANIEAVLFSKTDQGMLHLRFKGATSSRKNKRAAQWCQARFMNYVITDDYRSCGQHDFSLTPWLVADIIDQDKPHLLHAMQTRPIWCTIEVPHSAKEGDYSVLLEVLDANNNVQKTLTLNIHVDSHTLPTPANQKFHLDLWQQPYAVSRYYNVERWSPQHIDHLRPYLQALGRAGQKVVSTIMFYEPWGQQSHDKFSPMVQSTKNLDGTWSYDYTIFDQYVELCAEYGISEQINCYSMVPWDMTFRYFDQATGQNVDLQTTTNSEEYRNLWDNFLDHFKAHLIAKGWFSKTCIAMDERNESSMLDAYAIAHAKGFKMALAGNYHASLSDKLYDYCVAPGQVEHFTSEQLNNRRNQGLKTTFYVCCADPEPNIFSCSLPAEAAFLPLHAAANNLDGFLHWSWINWDEHPLTDTRFRLFGSGDTYLYYPGNRSSIRFERLIEGIQQYEKIQILKQEYHSDPAKLATLHQLLSLCQPFAATNCAQIVDQMEDFLNGKTIITLPADTTVSKE